MMGIEKGLSRFSVAVSSGYRTETNPPSQADWALLTALFQAQSNNTKDQRQVVLFVYYLKMRYNEEDELILINVYGEVTMDAIKAIYNGIGFTPIQPIPVTGEYEVIITFIAPINKKAVRPPFEYDSMAGNIWMADDFDEPLEDFREYME